MIFQKNPPREAEIEMEAEEQVMDMTPRAQDEVETVVGPSVNVEGDFASEGDIIVKGSVSGSVHTSRHLSVEPGAKILANVRSGSAKIAGEVKGNMKIKETLELAPTARVLGDLEVKTLIVAAGALICGKISMPGLEGEAKSVRSSRAAKKVEETVVPPAV